MDKYTLKAGRTDRFFTKAVEQETKRVHRLSVPEAVTDQDDKIYIYKAKDADIWFIVALWETYVLTSFSDVELVKERFLRGER